MQHEFSRRVYYESTDAGGVVYHADYLSFFAQARVEWARQHGWHIGELHQQGIIMPIRKLAVHYMKPAFLDDLLIIQSRIAKLGRCSVAFEQYAFRDNDRAVPICEVHTDIACVNAQLKPISWPAGLWDAMTE